DKSKQDELDKQQAEKKLQSMLGQKRWAAEQEEKARDWAEQQAAQKAERARLEAAKPHYPSWRLASAAKLKNYAPIEEPGLRAVLNTLWKDGKMHYRVALF